MKTRYITDRYLLNERLAELETEKEKYENRISNNMKDIYAVVLNPAPIIKRTVKDLAQDKSVQSDLLKVGISTATNFLVDRFAGKVAAGGVDWVTKFLSKIISERKSKQQTS